MGFILKLACIQSMLYISRCFTAWVSPHPQAKLHHQPVHRPSELWGSNTVIKPLPALGLHLTDPNQQCSWLKGRDASYAGVFLMHTFKWESVFKTNVEDAGLNTLGSFLCYGHSTRFASSQDRAVLHQGVHNLRHPLGPTSLTCA